MPAVLTWALAWGIFKLALGQGAEPGVALGLASALGVGLSLCGDTWWRRLLIAAGFPLSLALSQARVWGQKEKLFERAVPLLADHHLARWLAAASVCDGLVKGLRHPDWPNDPWDALQRLVLMMLEPLRPLAPAARAGAPVLALQAGQ